MTKKKNHAPEFKVKVALEAIRKEMALCELSKNYGVHVFAGKNREATQISR